MHFLLDKLTQLPQRFEMVFIRLRIIVNIDNLQLLTMFHQSSVANVVGNFLRLGNVYGNRERSPVGSLVVKFISSSSPKFSSGELADGPTWDAFFETHISQKILKARILSISLSKLKMIWPTLQWLCARVWRNEFALNINRKWECWRKQHFPRYTVFEQLLLGGF